MKWIDHIFDFISSIRLAVVVIVGLAVVAAVGTIYEARFDAEVARKLVYQSPYMYAVMACLVINLIAVMVSRWPWRKFHTGFILAHIGIITMLLGAFITQKIGIDGSMAFEIGQKNRFATVNDTELGVYSTFDGNGMTRLYQQAVDFFMNSPAKKNFIVQLGDEQLKVVDYYNYAIRQTKVIASDRPADGPAIRVQLQNPNVNISQWILRDPRRKFGETNLGPARVVLSDGSYKPDDGNVVVLTPDYNRKKTRFDIYTKSRGGLSKSGWLKEGEVVDTGWMGMQLRLLQYLPKAREESTYLRRESPTTMTRSAIRIQFRGEEHWLGLNSVLRLYQDSNALMVTFASRRIDVGFQMALNKFDVGHYPGTTRAASYESNVEVDGLGNRNISMNEPLHYKGFTFYQASFEQDEAGKPTTSILSVNYDPGRPLKYLGSLMVVLGVIMLFYFKRFGRKSAGESAK